MARIGVTNQEAFLRKMALDGLVIKLELPELKQMISLLALHEQQHQPDRQTAQRERQSLRHRPCGDSGKAKALWGLANKILMKLSTIQ